MLGSAINVQFLNGRLKNIQQQFLSLAVFLFFLERLGEKIEEVGGVKIKIVVMTGSEN
jgi:hypothetical protein